MRHSQPVGHARTQLPNRLSIMFQKLMCRAGANQWCYE